MTDLTGEEQQRVRATLHYLRRQMGGWVPVSKALGCNSDSVKKIANAHRNVTASMALRTARLVDVPIDDLISGRYRRGSCPRCGHLPDLEKDPTVVDDTAPRPDHSGGLKLVT